MYSHTTTADLGTPPSAAGRSADVTLEIDGVAVTVPEGTSIMRAAALARPADPEAVRHRYAEGVRLVPPVPGRNRRPPRVSRLVHDAGRRRHEGADREPEADEAPPRRHGAVPLGSSARLRQLPGQRPLRAAGHGRGARRHRNPLRSERRTTTGRCQGHQQSVLHLRPVDVHRLLALRARLRRGAGHVRADDPGARLRVEGRRPARTSRSCVGMRLVRRLRRGVPDRGPDREVADPARPARRAWSRRPARTAASAVRSRPRSRATRSSAWRRTGTATPTTATRASRGGSRSATRRIPIASRRR